MRTVARGLADTAVVITENGKTISAQMVSHDKKRPVPEHGTVPVLRSTPRDENDRRQRPPLIGQRQRPTEGNPGAGVLKRDALRIIRIRRFRLLGPGMLVDHRDFRQDKRLSNAALGPHPLDHGSALEKRPIEGATHCAHLYMQVPVLVYDSARQHLPIVLIGHQQEGRQCAHRGPLQPEDYPHLKPRILKPPLPIPEQGLAPAVDSTTEEDHKHYQSRRHESAECHQALRLVHCSPRIFYTHLPPAATLFPIWIEITKGYNRIEPNPVHY